MFFNGGMTIWILAIVLIACVTLAGWRQGAIRAAFSFVGIVVAALLAASVGKMVQPLAGLAGASNPVLAWAIAPVIGFALVSLAFKVVAHNVHSRIEMFYKYKAGDLRLSLWERLNTRLGICVGLANGALYFVLLTFFIFNLSYWTLQTATAPNQPFFVGLVNQLGKDLRDTGLARTATAVGTLPAQFYQLADLSGLALQNPQVVPRLANYPALTSLWEREDLQPLLHDATLTNALTTGGSPAEWMNNPNVQAFLANKELTQLVLGILQTNLDDLTAYLQTGKSAKYDPEKVIGRWSVNVDLTVARLPQERPRILASEMRAAKAWTAQAYGKTRILATGDNKLYIRGLPVIKMVVAAPPAAAKPAPTRAPAARPAAVKPAEEVPAPVTEFTDWKGDWTRTGSNYDLNIAASTQNKTLTATADDAHLIVQDGKTVLVYDRVN